MLGFKSFKTAQTIISGIEIYTCYIKDKYPFEEATKILLLAFTPFLANDWPIQTKIVSRFLMRQSRSILIFLFQVGII